GGVTVIGESGSQRYEAGTVLPFEAFRSSAREVVQTFDPATQVSGYEHSDEGKVADGPKAVLSASISNSPTLTDDEKVDLLAKLQAISEQQGPSETEDHLVDLVLELRQGLREAKRFDL